MAKKSLFPTVGKDTIRFNSGFCGGHHLPSGSTKAYATKWYSVQEKVSGVHGGFDVMLQIEGR